MLLRQTSKVPRPLPTSHRPRQLPEPAWPAYTEKQTAVARQMVSDLDVAIKEDAQGNVISVNTAANRSRVDNYQMQEILAFPPDSHRSWSRDPASITPWHPRSPNRLGWNRFPSKAH